MKPECCMGFSEKQIDREVKRLKCKAAWVAFFTGQTGFMCKKHGLVTYECDWERFLRRVKQ